MSVLPTSHVRMVQSLAVAWLMTGNAFYFPAPSGLGPAWSIVLAGMSVALSAVIVSGRWVRLACAGLAGVVAVEMLSVPSQFSNNRCFVVALLVMVALSSAQRAQLPRFQVALVWSCSALDKMLSADWRQGVFVESFVQQLARFGLMWSPGGSVGAENPAAIWASTLSHEAFVWAGMTVIAVELVLALAFACKWQVGAWLNLAFHLVVLTFTGSTMGMFFFAGVASALLVLPESALIQRAAPTLALTAALVVGAGLHRMVPLGVFIALTLGLLVSHLTAVHRERSARAAHH